MRRAARSLFCLKRGPKCADEADGRGSSRGKAAMIRSLFAYIFMFTAGLASAAAYFYSIHPEHVPEEDFPRMRLDLEDAMERARRAKDAWESQPKEQQAQAAPKVNVQDPPAQPTQKAPAKPPKEPAPKKSASIVVPGK